MGDHWSHSDEYEKELESLRRLLWKQIGMALEKEDIISLRIFADELFNIDYDTF